MKPLPIKIMLNTIPLAQPLEHRQLGAQIVGAARVDFERASRARLHVDAEFVDDARFGGYLCLGGGGGGEGYAGCAVAGGCGWGGAPATGCLCYAGLVDEVVDGGAGLLAGLLIRILGDDACPCCWLGCLSCARWEDSGVSRLENVVIVFGLGLAC